MFHQPGKYEGVLKDFFEELGVEHVGPQSHAFKILDPLLKGSGDLTTVVRNFRVEVM